MPGRQPGVTSYYGVVRAIFGSPMDAKLWLDAIERVEARARYIRRPLQVREWNAERVAVDGAVVPGDVIPWEGIPPEDSIPPTSWEVIVKDEI